ncbi:2-C-methyl-D-erythritol 4-phosphate cytidylyltransferase [Psychrosphaera aquimarina]|uniref:2-C-methyl-D-erythritol 4-phosphate cytidylyltransferase n=1 Tax=Psychrosphaera aquimarina TaxID=2044854 RepID=A0ABU3R415_9GAMM|nr:2-C-methyl-D-erythritol 4-phosphate cytidylyltransferase [Psychrosphaera aquimarina]MDU0114038.1 2-C-methyl-D-erythritol 4-phosphate cytidylyltransferase [Psychrosphaera aquimarina]
MVIDHMFSVVIPASGIGKRMQAEIPKQYLPLLDKSVLEHTIGCFTDLPFVDEVVVVIAQHDEMFNTLKIANHPKIHKVIGGKERANSVFNGIKYLYEKGTQWVMVHDAARPCVEQDDIVNLAQHCFTNKQAGILGSPVRDTMKRAGSNSNLIEHTEERNGLWHAFTPQCSNVSQLFQALNSQISTQGDINPRVTDEASALEMAGFPVALVNGSAKNIKITQPEDLALAEYYIKSKKQ